jgi:hypothetical protein
MGKSKSFSRNSGMEIFFKKEPLFGIQIPIK